MLPLQRLRTRAPWTGRALLAALCVAHAAARPISAQTPDLARQVEIRRTTYGIPHIKAENLRAAGFALGWVQLEDYGDRVPLGLLRARGELARHTGPEAVESDFRVRPRYQRALESYHLLDQDTRDVYEGFAAGVNRYLELHAGEFPAWLEPDFTGHDVHAQGIDWASPGDFRRFVERLDSAAAQRIVVSAGEEAPNPEDGSNAWAFAPSRTKSGKAILLRNPHLSWTAGYYEGHVTVPGKLDFYGDFRIGGPLGIIGGFNARLGWATTNNYVDTDEVYALDVDPERPDHYLFDGGSVPLRREVVAVEFRNGEGIGRETREYWTTPLGPVIHRAHGRIYVHRSTSHGEYRAGMQFLRMMQARNLEEWKAAMRIRGRAVSNLTYADADGNIFYVWNGTLPLLPHPPGGDTAAVPARRTSELWTRVLPWDSLPQLRNPKGGYLHNENDSPHYANLNQVLDPADFPPNLEEPRLRLRSQHALELIHDNRKLSLEDVVRLKHSMRMLLADRVKGDLVAAVRAANPTDEVAVAIGLIERWDNTVAPESRGGVLFEAWWRRYGAGLRGDTALFREPWTPERPMATPRGLRHAGKAAEAFARAVEETKERFGSWDVAWGEVHRVRRGDVDVPVGGCSGALGCFRVLSFQEAPDGKRVANSGDGWVLAVEFGKTPRAYSVLAYGQSAKEDSPHFDDQAALFARGEMKAVAFTEAEIERQLVRQYRPGVEP